MSGEMNLEPKLIVFSIFDSVAIKVGFFNISCSDFLPFIALTFPSQAKLMRRRHSCTPLPVSRYIDAIAHHPNISPWQKHRCCWTLQSRRTEWTGVQGATLRRAKLTDLRCFFPSLLNLDSCLYLGIIPSMVGSAFCPDGACRHFKATL